MSHTSKSFIFIGLFILIAFQNTSAQIRADYEETVKKVLEKSAGNHPISDSLLVASYPKNKEEHALLHHIVENDSTPSNIYLKGFRNRDTLVEESIKKGNLELLKAHLILSTFIEGDEAMWYVENLDPMLVGPEINKICDVVEQVVKQFGKQNLPYIQGLVENCESGEWSKY